MELTSELAGRGRNEGDLASASGTIRADASHLRLEIEHELMSTDERERAAATLRHALGILEGRGTK